MGLLGHHLYFSDSYFFFNVRQSSVTCNFQTANCIRKCKFLLHSFFLTSAFIYSGESCRAGFGHLPEAAGTVPEGALQNSGGAAHMYVVVTVKNCTVELEKTTSGLICSSSTTVTKSYDSPCSHSRLASKSKM